MPNLVFEKNNCPLDFFTINQALNFLRNMEIFH